MSNIYPRLLKNDKVIRRTVECQSDSDSFVGSPKAHESLSFSSPKASSTPKGEIQLKAGFSHVKENETILAGHTASPMNSVYDHDNTHSNTSIVEHRTSYSLLFPDEYWNTFVDFKQCCRSGEWGDFIGRHHLRILFLILLIMVVYSVFTSFTSTQLDRENIWKDYRQELRLLKKDFSGLTKQDENALLVVGQQWINEAQQEPIVLTIGGPNSSSFTEKLHKILTKISKPKVRRPMIAADSKLSRPQLHASLKADAKSNDMPVSAIQSIDRLSWDSPLVLQAFSDPDAYLAPNSVVLLSVKDAQVGDIACEAGLSEHLTDKWISSGGNMDNVAPVISRIMGYTICI